MISLLPGVENEWEAIHKTVETLKGVMAYPR